ncbi:hypothetical protein KR018_009846 [Drosophila ironensis]|nr:hypothetical protein KR018_009846 [Drosophila ironensis]
MLFRGSINIVRLGELDFESDKDDADPEDFGVRGDPIIYPGYEYPAFYNDIAIVRLNRKVIFNEYKRAACLPFEDGRHSRSLVAIGWGQTAFVPRPGEESSKVLQKVTLSNYFNYCQRTAEKSEELPQGYNATTQLCIGSSGHKDTCNGDSGGPALSYHRGSPCGYYLTGITSFGVACDTPGLPGMYTRVYFYVNWIKQEMAKFL